jgi:uncharacterized protein (DUF1501 family)
MKRRSFLKTSSVVSLPLLLNGMPISAYSRSRLFNFLNTETDKVLVLIQLNGGNDGLNTILPLDQYDNLANVRSNIIIPEGSALPIDDVTAFHPNMTGLRDLYLDGKMEIVQSVGYPNQNRSHFRSTDIWTSGSPADEAWNTGWLGRWMDGDHPTFPDAYPNPDFPDPLALTVGSLVSTTCQGSAANFSLAIEDPFSLSQLATGGEDTVPPTPYGEELQFLRTSIAQSNAYSDIIVDAANAGSNIATYPDNNRLAQQLKNIALLISGGLQTKIYVASLGGFDTHANQTDANDPTVGEHANLLQTLSDAIASFQADLDALGIADRVAGMTFSEFGRRIRSNDSLGTDHGTAAPLILFGSCVSAGIIGDNPEITTDVGVQDGVPMQYDFRDVYGSVLMDWFEVEESTVKQLLHDDFSYISLLQGCNTTAVEEVKEAPDGINLSLWPNPFRDQLQIQFNSERERVRLSVFNTMGSELEVVFDRTLPAGPHTVQFDGSKLPPGTYAVRLQMDGTRQKTRLVVKQ